MELGHPDRRVVPRPFVPPTKVRPASLGLVLRFKALFNLEEHVWHTGLDNNRTQSLAALLLYQLLLVYNRVKGEGNADVK